MHSSVKLTGSFPHSAMCRGVVEKGGIRLGCTMVGLRLGNNLTRIFGILARAGVQPQILRIGGGFDRRL
jgi:hypothetical protein